MIQRKLICTCILIMLTNGAMNKVYISYIYIYIYIYTLLNINSIKY